MKTTTTQSPYVTRRGSLCPVPAVSILPWGRAHGGGGVPVQTLGGPLYLFAYGVDPIRPQKRHCLLHQVRPPTVQHPETQVLLKLGFDGHCIQLPRSAKAVVGPKEGRDGQLGAAASPGLVLGGHKS